MTDRRNIVVTGGCGFIGCALVRHLIKSTSARIINVDKLTYASTIDSLDDVLADPRHVLERVDICDGKELRRIFRQYAPDAVIHLAAESHVDRSIEMPAAFIETNVVGTYTLLEAGFEFWSSLDQHRQAEFRFHHVSTDEVYGDLGPGTATFREDSPYAPSSPYSASKAASDHLVRAWHRTYGFPVVVTNCSNNYGPYQFPEKLIPLMITNALDGKELPVYGDGSNVRDWLYVEDHVRALCLVLEKGRLGRTYNIGGGSQHTNLEVVREICACLDRLRPDPSGPYERLVRFVRDRPGHDVRYAIDNTRIRQELGWVPSETFESGITRTVQWYLEHRDWCTKVRSGEYLDWIEKNYGGRGTAE